MGRIFGTDGARGVVGAELTAELAVNIGRAAAMVLAEQTHKKPLVVIGMDTRISGDMLQAAVTAGLCSVGADVLLLGVVPTPAVAYLVQHYHADAGVMLSASHNPYEFNGIKLFGSKGYKLTDAQEEEIESIILDNSRPYDVKKGSELGRVSEAGDACEIYVNHLASIYNGGFEGKILVDCANGSASATARMLFKKLGVSASFVYDEPDGININDNCGSTHVEKLAEKVISGGYTLGLAFDGDADRLLAVDQNGRVLDGDILLSVLSEYLSERGELNDETVVVTSMTNLGFFKLMQQRGKKTEVTKVGDRYVLEAMREKGYVLGGEQSGHMIFLDHATTGDGQLSAIMLLNAAAASKRPLAEIAGEMKQFPQTMLNVDATPSMKRAYDSHPAVTEVISNWEKTLGDRGRIVVRPSGTEPYIRVMVEGESLQEIEQAAAEIAAAIRIHLI
ncbi:MAG: phosphoglucosamine mutase [Oscillospiraceae bacterium]|nr:phosphoglucosamine mutase [Oscillospiraceae bacterium]